MHVTFSSLSEESLQACPRELSALTERLAAGRSITNKVHARQSICLQGQVLTGGALACRGWIFRRAGSANGEHRRERSPPSGGGHMRHSRSLSQLSQQRQKQQQAASEALRPQVRI